MQVLGLVEDLAKDQVEDRAGGQVEDRVEAQAQAQDLAKGQVEGQAEDLAVGLGLNQSLLVDSLQLLCHIYRTYIFCNHLEQKLSTMSSS